MQAMGAAVRPASTAPASWDAFADGDAFVVDEVLTELASMAAEGTQTTRSGSKPALTGQQARYQGHRAFGWLAPYRRLNTVVERTKEHLIAFVQTRSSPYFHAA